MTENLDIIQLETKKMESVVSDYQIVKQDPDIPLSENDLIATHLSVDEASAEILCRIFDPVYYSSLYLKSEDYVDDSAALEHYLSIGLDKDYIPNPFFDPQLVLTSEKYTNHVSTDINRLPAILWWLKFGQTTVVPTELFDNHFYKTAYKDLESWPGSAYPHFILHGIHEYRFPCEALSSLYNSSGVDDLVQVVPIAKLLAAIPVQFHKRYFSQEVISHLQTLFMPELYRRAAELGDDIDDRSAFFHFLSYGISNGLRPSVLFNADFYELQFNRSKSSRLPWLNANEPVASKSIAGTSSVGPYSSYLHWYFVGREYNIVPTPLFNSSIYLNYNGDIVRNWRGNAFEHYILNGYLESSRKSCAYFEPSFYLNQCGSAGLQHSSVLLDYVLRGEGENLLPCSGISLEKFCAKPKLQSSRLEQMALYMERRLSRLESGTLSQLLEKAVRIEPLVSRAYPPTNVRMAPVLHQDVNLLVTMRKVISNLKGHYYENIVLIPHCRMAGSAQIAGHFTKSLEELGLGSRTLLVTTDLVQFDRPEWFSQSIDYLDISENLESLPPEAQERALLDLLRGLKAKRVFNINSNLCWRTMRSYGRQLSSWMDMYCYLFCWDINSDGHRGGYPIQWFQSTFGYLKGVFTDSEYLRNELIERYSLNRRYAEKIVTLYTPSSVDSYDYSEAIAARTLQSEIKRCFWAGRFDRQKRFDLVVEIARRAPDLEIWVWGKSVLNDSLVDFDQLPSNIRLMGEYRKLDDVPISGCDFMLYTSEWDGLPTVLIEAGERGIPVVASAVCGVPEIVNSNTGYPVADVLNVECYLKAIAQLYKEPEKTYQKSQRLRQKTLTEFTMGSYVHKVGCALQIEAVNDVI